MKVTLITIAFSLSTHVFACTCLHSRKVSIEDLLFNDVIFKGKILATEIVKNNDEPLLKAVFIVQKSIIPEQLPDTISVFTATGGTACGLSFQKGDTWLIFAGYRGNYYEGSWCSNSREQTDKKAEKEIKEIMDYFDTIRNKQLINEEISGVGDYGPYHIIGQLKSGKPVGPWTKIKGKDTIAFYNFKDGKQFGLQKEIDPITFSVEEYQIDYQNNEKIEKRVTYTRDKKMTWLIEFKNGVAHGKFEMSFASDTQKGQYANGKKEGEWVNYSHGKIRSKQFYVNDEVKESIVYDDAGNVIKKED